ncbi:MAG: GNAT family N-acetyltransferase [Nitrososphaerota archaeon]|nr:GNAT family N-acetyltransferase [Nitrososphaerota archaeon]MDG6941760.1 GNAT family N-acetyltransferase [Nitrososphaerota archaeon]MDG6947067.1 GNAT family N-acetyltransferase [Nitrososphaerota archaeon]MDG6950521.1 GNAT family N-acetyltransferase [Nitrososphaerota archaeon]
MDTVVVRRGRRSDAVEFIELVMALARFEKLAPPTTAGKRRLIDDIFLRKRINLFVASRGKKLVGYALYFYSYSSFLARPTLYLEDLFVSEESRREGTGMALLKRCAREARAKGCGRMEWAVLRWNGKAQRFYENLGAKRMEDWYLYRLDEQSLRALSATATARARHRKASVRPAL